MVVKELEELSDESLMKRYGEGNARAFEMLYQRHKGPLYRFLLRQLSDRATVDELFQDVWSKLIAQRSDYHVSAKFSTWLYTLARNRVIDHYRVQGKRDSLSFSLDDDSFGEVSEGGQQLVCEHRPELVLESDKAAAKLKLLVQQLPPSQREAFVLKHDAGFNHRDIAEITGHKEETIKSQIRYAINKLKQGLFGGHHE